MRLDKYLWAVRLFKTRSLATKACNSGHVRCEGQKLKPSRDAMIGMKLDVDTGHQLRIIEVKGMPESRVGAPIVEHYLIDHTPPPEPKDTTQPKRERGAGRPSKRDRREIERLFSEDDF